MDKIIKEEYKENELNSDMIERLDCIENAAQRIILNEIHGQNDDFKNDINIIAGQEINEVVLNECKESIRKKVELGLSKNELQEDMKNDFWDIGIIRDFLEDIEIILYRNGIYVCDPYTTTDDESDETVLCYDDTDCPNRHKCPFKKESSMSNCDKCNQEKKEEELIRATVNGKSGCFCKECINSMKNVKISSIGVTRMLPYGTGAPTTDITFYFQVSPEYFGNADKAKISYSIEKQIDDEKMKLWENMAKLTLTSQAMLLPFDNCEEVLKLLKAEDKKAITIYESIKAITKEQYNEI